MDNRGSKFTNVSIGMSGSLIITIFVVLCLTVFSVLSFTTAHSDLKLANKTKEVTGDYYLAHGAAEEKLAKIHNSLMSITNNSMPSEEYIKAYAEAVKNIDGVSTVNLTDSSLTVYYETSGDKNQKICSTIEINYDEIKKIPNYDILTWNLETIELPLYEEENYNLWEGFE